MKYLAILVLAISLIFPANSVNAGFSVEDYFANKIIENVTNAKSVEFEFDLHVNAQDGDNELDLVLDASLHGAIDDINTDNEMVSIDASYDSILNGNESDNSGSAVLTKDRAYFVDHNNSDWYFIDLETSPEYSLITDEVEDVSSDWSFDTFVITDQLDDISVDGVKMARYVFTIDPSEVINLMRSSNEFAEQDLVDFENYMNDYLEFDGEIWVNKQDLVPYKITINGGVDDNERDIYVDVEIDLVFTSFNEDLDIQEPVDAIDYAAHIESLYGDVDGDGLTASQEARYGTDPNNPDTDGDGYKDGVEVRNGYNPLSLGQLDSDNDTLGDHDEMTIWHTNRFNADTDGDGYSDATEIYFLYNPNGAGLLDTDNDGVSDHDEMFVYNTNRFSRDTDGDGYADGTEIHFGYNPNGPGRI